MKRLTFFAAVAASLVASAAMLDGVAARIDSRVITVGDVMAELRRHPEIREKVKTSGDESEMQALYRAALDMLIERRLILKAAAAKKMEIPEWVIDNQIREIVHDMFGGVLYLAPAFDTLLHLDNGFLERFGRDHFTS